MLCTSNNKWSDDAKVLRSWGRSSSLLNDSENIEKRLNFSLDNIAYDAKFIFEKIGYNFEPSEMGAAFGLVQLSKLNENVKIRKKNFDKHYKFVSEYQDLFIKPKVLEESDTSFLAFPLQLKNDNKFKRNDLQLFLEKKDIQTRVIFTGNILRQPGFKKIKHISKNSQFTNADKVMKNGILIGCHQGLKDNDLEYIHKSIIEFIK